jgi:hypothetical protein
MGKSAATGKNRFLCGPPDRFGKTARRTSDEAPNYPGKFAPSLDW